MKISNLKDVYVDQLKDLYSANKQSLVVTQKLQEKATDRELAEALEAGHKGIQEGISAMESILAKHNEPPTGEHCKGMEGLVGEAHAHVIDKEFDDADARDAMIISQYQRMVHYAIAGYGCLAAFAKRLDEHQDENIIRKCLDETYSGDRRMTGIATGSINKKAA